MAPLLQRETEASVHVSETPSACALNDLLYYPSTDGNEEIAFAQTRMMRQLHVDLAVLSHAPGVTGEKLPKFAFKLFTKQLKPTWDLFFWKGRGNDWSNQSSWLQRRQQDLACCATAWTSKTILILFCTFSLWMTFAEQRSCSITARRGTFLCGKKKSINHPCINFCCTRLVACVLKISTQETLCEVRLSKFSVCTQTLSRRNNPSYKPAYKQIWHHYWGMLPARSLRTQGQPVTIRQSDMLYKYIFIEAGQK